jgi:hypothetical protein
MHVISTIVHLGHPRVTVACQSDSALFTLGLNLAKSTPLATGLTYTNPEKNAFSEFFSKKTPRIL